MLDNKLKNFLSEIQMLKRLDHIGMKLAAVDYTDSLADHVALSSQIAFVLAELEGADPYKTAVINLFHDNHEARIGDQNKVSSRYIDTKEAQRLADEEHLSNLPLTAAKKIKNLLVEKHERSTQEGIIAQDADWLEQAIEAKIQLEKGYQGAQIWINNVRHALETESAKEILDLIDKEKDFTNCWWVGIQKMTYKKLKEDEI